jgi:hypothetical protein
LPPEADFDRFGIRALLEFERESDRRQVECRSCKTGGSDSYVLVEEFLARLNTRAGSLPSKQVRPRMLEDWVYEDLVTGPTQIGGDWQWSEKSLSEALGVAEYRQRGFKRATAIRFQKWLEDNSPATIIDSRTIKKEICRAQKILIRYVTSTHGIRPDFKLTQYRRKGLLRTLGPLDSTLEQAGLGAGETVSLLFYELGRFGEQITPFDEEGEPLAAWVATLRWPDRKHIFAGVLEPDIDQEFSVIQVIERLTPTQLERCRAWTQFFSSCLFAGVIAIGRLDIPDPKKQLLMDAYEKAAASLSVWPWSIFLFATAMNIMYHSEVALVFSGG